MSDTVSTTETAVTLNPPSTTEPGDVMGRAAGSPAEVDEALLDATLEYIRPALQADGGDLVLVGVDDNGTVNLQLVGACGGCPMSMMTLKAGIERILTDRVPGVTAVNAT